MATFSDANSANRSFNSGTSSLVLSKDGEAVMGRASDPMTSMSAMKPQNDHDKSKAASNKVDPYEFLDDSDAEGSATEKLSASDLMMEPGTLSKAKLDTADLKLLDSEESEPNDEFRQNASAVPMTFPSSGQGNIAADNRLAGHQRAVTQ